MKKVLFICTGNYYRSRFAEAVFNHHAEQGQLRWRAFSRGLAIEQTEGPLSEFTREALVARGIDLRHTGPTRSALTEEDLRAAALAIALQDSEHRPMVAASFPAWVGRITFWDVADVPFRPPHEALPEIEQLVTALLDSLRE